MKSKKWIFAAAIIILGLISLLYVGYKTNNLRLGMIRDDLPTLVSGDYKNNDNLSLKPGVYAIYAKRGKGEIRFAGKLYKLDDALFVRAQKQPGNVKNAVIYEESPKISIDEDSKISVKGDQEFLVSFVKR